MDIPFIKYQAGGNDFILIDNRNEKYQFTTTQIKQICHRRFGVGADGMLIITPHAEVDFHLRYVNADGSESFCGNGSRVALRWIFDQGITNNPAYFAAYDGIHQGKKQSDGRICLLMHDVDTITKMDNDFFVNTGSPHFIRFVKNVEKCHVVEEGRHIRYSQPFQPDGVNVNFVQQKKWGLILRTYERGVEDETLSCGTGVTAVGLVAAAYRGYTSPIQVETKGGKLQITFSYDQKKFTNIYLWGEEKLVFQGQIHLT